MKKFHDIISSLNEGTQDVYNAITKVKGQKLLAHAGKRSKKVMDAHDKIFGAHNQHLDLGEVKHDIPDVVKEHIEGNGDTINHEKKSVTLKSGREVSIDKYLGRSLKDVHPEKKSQILSEWQHHTRNASSDTKLVLSRHPGDVASGSTGTHWDSCAKLDGDGPAAEAMPAELKHGTLIAMHVHKDSVPSEDGSYHSKDILGRMYVKPHKDERGELAYIPEGRSYGTFPKDAHKKLEDKFTKNLTGAFYEKHEDVYNDKHSSFINDIDKALKSKSPKVRAEALRSEKPISHEQLTKSIDDDDPDVAIAAIRHPNVTGDHISKALDHHNAAVRFWAIRNKNATVDHISKAMDDKEYSVRAKAVGHQNATSEHISKGLMDKSVNVRISAIENPNATSEHISKAMDDENDHVRKEAKHIAANRGIKLDTSKSQSMHGVNESSGDNALITADGIRVKDLKAKKLAEKPMSKKIVTFKELQKNLNKGLPNVMDTKFSPGIVKDLDEAYDPTCPVCKSKSCDCELSDKDIDDIVDKAEDEDFADLYDDSEFAEVDENGKKLSESINEVLSREARLRKRALFALTQSKRDRKRIIALHKFSSGTVLAKRARHMAVNLLKKRLARGKPYEKLSVGEKERIDQRIERMKNTVARIAVRLGSKIRKIERERMSHRAYTKDSK